MKNELEVLKKITAIQTTLDNKIQQLENAQKSFLLDPFIQKALIPGSSIQDLLQDADYEIESAKPRKQRFLARQKKNALLKLKRVKISIRNLEDQYDLFADSADKYKSSLMYSLIEKQITDSWSFEKEEALENLLETVRLALLNYFPIKAAWGRTDDIQKKIDDASKNPEIQKLLKDANQILSQEIYKEDVDKESKQISEKLARVSITQEINENLKIKKPYPNESKYLNPKKRIPIQSSNNKVEVVLSNNPQQKKANVAPQLPIAAAKKQIIFSIEKKGNGSKPSKNVPQQNPGQNPSTLILPQSKQ